MKRLLIAISLAALAASAVTPVAAREPSADPAAHTDNLPGPLAQKQSALKAAALDLVLSGEATPTGKNKVVKLAPGQYVELAFEGEDQILTLLGEFGSGDPTHNHGAFGVITHTGDAFAHNSIPEPDRSVDNSTIWEEDFSQAYYDNLLYNKAANPSMANWYLEQSSGTYSVDGYVGDWVEVPNNPSAYGSNYCGSIVCTRDVGRFIEDQADLWWNDLVAERGLAGANALLATFDIWDRYDFDGDGDFDEPDGYIDHFQSVHAGEGEETGGGALGEDAIWSHRSYVNSVPFGTGPTGGAQFGGARIGTSNYWIGDYTVEPENGGVGVFAHEFAHDLGLPDLYDTSGNTGGAENSTGFWTIMSSGSYGSVNGIDIGSAPTHFGAWEKFQLGFLRNYAVGFAGQRGTYTLGPAEYNTKKPQAMFVVLPDKEVSVNVGSPFAGGNFYHSGSGNDLDHNMTRPITLGAGPISMSFQGRWHIEPCWDYAYIEVSTDGGATFTSIANSAESDENTNGNNFGHGITGVSGVAGPASAHCDDLSQAPAWVPVTADLSAYANQTIQLRFRYWTDGAVVGDGFGVDNLQITGQPLDDAETDPGWTYDGFFRTGGTVTQGFFNAYVLENRQYIGYDQALLKGPYNFGFPARPNYVEHFPYQDGLLISYWDESVHDNNVGDHPGSGWVLPVDSHPQIETWADGSQMRPRIQSYDSTFTTTRTDGITLHNPADGVAKTIASKPAVSVFNDALRDGDGTSIYWRPGHPSDAPSNGRYQAEWNSVDVPNTGTKIRVRSISSTGVLTLDLNK